MQGAGQGKNRYLCKQPCMPLLLWWRKTLNQVINVTTFQKTKVACLKLQMHVMHLIRLETRASVLLSLFIFMVSKNEGFYRFDRRIWFE